LHTVAVAKQNSNILLSYLSSLLSFHTRTHAHTHTPLAAAQRVGSLFMRLPNLLDPRVVDGDGEQQNELVSEWGQEYIKVKRLTSAKNYA
jgi:seryl-tRNA synthetase